MIYHLCYMLAAAQLLVTGWLMILLLTDDNVDAPGGLISSARQWARARLLALSLCLLHPLGVLAGFGVDRQDISFVDEHRHINGSASL